MSKKILITGASSGFGKEIARKLHKSGNKLLLVARRIDRLEELADELGSNVDIRRIDVTKSNDIKDLFSTLPGEFENLDVLINNAGLALGIGKVPDVDLEDWSTMIDTNNRGLVEMTLHATKIMKTNRKGHIVNIGSVSATVPYPGGNVYGATKAFVKQFSRNLRVDLHGFNIRVSNIEPGMAETEFGLVRFKGDTEKAKALYEGYRQLTPQDVAEAVAWMIDQPDHVNIDTIEIMPTDQSIAGFQLAKEDS